MAKKLMILGASILQVPAIEKAMAMGLETVAVDMDPEAVGFCVPGVQKEVISTIDIPAVVEAAKRHKIDGIMTLATDMPMRSVAAVAKEMGLVGIDEETAIKATDKAEMRQTLAAAGVPIPRFYRVCTKETYKEAVSRFSVPFVVKPADSSGSRGIYLIKDLANQKEIDLAYDYSRGYSRSGTVVVEEYMCGPEVSVETLTVNGVCYVIQITDKLTTGAPHFVEMGHTQPTQHSPETAEEIARVAKAANDAIGIKNGPSHTEIIVTAEGPKVVELGARLGGDNITTHLVPLSTGVDMVECCIRIALGQQPDIGEKWQKGAAIRSFSQRPGKIRSITGLEEAEKIPGVCQINVVHGEGKSVTDIINSGARMGFVIARGEDAAQAAAACTSALACIGVEYE